MPKLLVELFQKKLGLAVRLEAESKKLTPPVNPPEVDAPPAPTVQVTNWFDPLRQMALPTPAERAVKETEELAVIAPLKEEAPDTPKVFKFVWEETVKDWPIPTLPVKSEYPLTRSPPEEYVRPVTVKDEPIPTFPAKLKDEPIPTNPDK